MARILVPIRRAVGIFQPFLFAALLAAVGMASVRPV
jgi:hypothetical protein